MLTFEKTKQENAIEEVFCKEFEKLTQYPMDEETTNILMRLLCAKSPIEIPEKEKPFIYKLIEKRLQFCFTIKIVDTRALMFLCVICERAGIAVMYLTYIQYWCKKRGIKEVNLETIVNIFPMGFPSEEDLHIVWEKQKVFADKDVHPLERGTDNLLDYASAGKSIQF